MTLGGLEPCPEQAGGMHGQPGAHSVLCPQHLADYVEQYVGTEGVPSPPTEGFLLKPVFLQR